MTDGISLHRPHLQRNHSRSLRDCAISRWSGSSQQRNVRTLSRLAQTLTSRREYDQLVFLSLCQPVFTGSILSKTEH